ncbi:MAG TPA: type II secretion system F family protein [Acidimicrobiia bacterium]|nr:type II secretion system F family protein [Acidimicrobiia bacterium]
MSALCLALGVATWLRRRGAVRPVAGAVLAWGVVSIPPVAAAIGSVALARRRWRRAARSTAARRAADEDVVLLVDLVALGIAAGHTVRRALAAAMPHLHPLLVTEVAALLETMDRDGTGGALTTAAGRLAELGRVCAAAAVSGAPLGPAVAAYADRLRHVRHEERIARARRLPVRLLLPLALLILPGFVVLAVGPALLQALARLGQ